LFAKYGAERDYGADQGADVEQLFEEFPHLRKRYWGRYFWARGVLLRHGRSDDGRDDQAVFGASLWADAEWRFQDGAWI